MNPKTQALKAKIQSHIKELNAYLLLIDFLEDHDPDYFDKLDTLDNGPKEKYPIPKNIKESLERYVKLKIPTGGFLRAVLENDLVEAAGRADDVNLHLIPQIVSYIYNELPSVCWGSPEKVSAWLSVKQNTQKKEN